MPKPSGTKIYDYISAFNEGMNAGIQPTLLPKNQLAFALNATVRGGFATNRPPFTKSLTFAWESDDVQTAVETGLFQGACYFKPDIGQQCLIAQISGYLYRFSISGSVVTVTDITVPGDPNPAARTQAWLWQADRWVIVNDGISLPIFYDGVTSRRSYGPSDEIIKGEVTPPGNVPAIGETVTLDIGLLISWPAPYDIPVLFNGEYYQPITGSGYQVSLKNIQDTSGTTYDELTPVVIQPSVVGIVSSEVELSFIGGGGQVPTGSLPFNVEIEYAQGISVGTLVTITSETTDSSGRTISIILSSWKVSAMSGSTYTLSRSAPLNLTSPWRIGYRYAAGAKVKLTGSSAPNYVVGNLASQLAPIAIGSSSIIDLSATYAGASNQLAFINDFPYAITGIPASGASGTVVLINLSDTAGVPYTAGDLPILSVPELTAGRMGAYVMGQNWMSLVDGLKFVVSDLSRGPSGTPANDYRDAVLKTVDLTFGGGAFAIPTSGTYITSITPVPKLDESLGQGPVQIGTTKGVFTATAPFDFHAEVPKNTAILPEVLKGYGPLGQNSTVLVNSDTFFRSNDGWASLILARREFQSWGNSSISNEVKERILNKDDEQLLPYGSAVVFDNRFIGTVSPQPSNGGVIHAGTIVINLDPVSSLRGKAESVYDGIWTGLNALQFVSGDFDNVNRAFAFGYNVETLKIELYELLPTDPENRFDNGYVPITWGFETAALFNRDVKEPEELIRLLDGEIGLDNVLGRVRVKIWYKFDQGCWIPWRDFSICADTQTDPQSYPNIGLGEPSVDDCDSVNETVAREGYTVQVRFQITGSCRFLRGRFKASTMPTPEFQEPICNEGCTPP